MQVVVGLLQQGLNDTPEDGGEGGAWSKIAALSGYSPEALAFLLRGPQKDDPGDAPAPWLQPQNWAMVCALADVEALGFEKLPSDLEENAPRFAEWFNHATPETEKLPLDWRDLDRRPFRKLLVVRCLRPDRLTSALMQFVRTTLPGGSGYADLDADSNSFGVLEQAFDDASPTVPIYFVLSPGANVVADVDKLAERDGMKAGETYFNVSLGQGQDVVAQERLEAAHYALGSEASRRDTDLGGTPRERKVLQGNFTFTEVKMPGARAAAGTACPRAASEREESAAPTFEPCTRAVGRSRATTRPATSPRRIASSPWARRPPSATAPRICRRRGR